VAGPREVGLYFLLGGLGGLLPDIDSGNSVPIQLAFTLASILLAFLLMFGAARWFPSLGELLVIWIAAFLLLRRVLFALLGRLTTHRGIFHSIPAALFFTLLGATLGFWLWPLTPSESWLCGLFIGFGYLVHLLLDELYSVNLYGLRTRRSAGSALKFWYRKSPPASVAMYLAVLLLFPFAPELAALQRTLATHEVSQRIGERLLPQQGWFRPVRPATPARIE
jgi:membrane-bound metal-dependent hydrolase YbcI (DUF457 family)